MKNKTMRLVLLTLTAILFLVSCSSPDSETPTPTDGDTPGVHTPKDMLRRYKEHPAEYKFAVDEDVFVLYAYPDPLIDWVGFAYILHIPSASEVVVDSEGSILFEQYNSDEAQAALKNVLADGVLMARIQARTDEIWGEESVSAIPTDEPTRAVEPAILYTPSPESEDDDLDELEEFFGVPPAAVLDVDGKAQVAGIGSYCWIEARDGATTVELCADTAGIITAAEPLQVESPLSAVFQLPIPFDPLDVTLKVIAVTPQDKYSDTEWLLKAGRSFILPLDTQPEIKLTLEPGLYVLQVIASWHTLGGVDYGFLIDVSPEPQPEITPTIEATPDPYPAPGTQPTVDPYPGPNDSTGGGSTSLIIPEVYITVFIPGDYTLVKNEELNRRGSFVSYDFTLSAAKSPPVLSEIQFFTEDSIQEFLDVCETDEQPCFFGDYPDMERYRTQKQVFDAGVNPDLREFGGRQYLIAHYPCEGDACMIREYTTFLGDVKVDIWVVMQDEGQAGRADILFFEFTIQEHFEPYP